MNTLRRWLALNLIPLTLGAWAALQIAFYSGGLLSNFLAPFFRDLALGSGILMALLSLVWAFLPAESCCSAEHHHDHDHDDPHRLSLARLAKFTLLLSPVLLFIVIKPESYSLTTIQNRGIATQAPRSAQPPASRKIEGEEIFKLEEPSLRPEPGAIAEMTVVDLLFLGDDPNLRAQYQGASVKVIGQVAPEKGAKDSFTLFRLVMTCCAADAQPAGFRVLLNGHPMPRTMGWFEILGKINFFEELGVVMPELTAESIEATSKPEEKFLY